MSELHFSLAHELEEALAMVESLDQYVRESEIYWNIGNNLPRLTLGGFLMRLHRLRQLKSQLNSQQAVTLYDIEDRYHEIVNEWRVHYSEKLKAEAESRLDVMAYYLTECGENPSSCAENYLPEAERRTLVQELLLEMQRLNVSEVASVQSKVNAVDGQLRSIIKSGKFLWDASLEPVYSEQAFWWLYGRPAKTN